MANKQFHCFSMKLAGWLMLNGCPMFEVQDDKNSRRKIYMFKDGDYLQGMIQKYKDEKYKFMKL